MKASTLTALKGSIRHWDDNRRLEEHDPHAVNSNRCALCNLFWDNDCHSCPVQEASGHRYCSLTPYEEAAEAHETWDNAEMALVDLEETLSLLQDDTDRATLLDDIAATRAELPAQRKQFRSLAELEFQFLVSLLPANEVYRDLDGKEWTKASVEPTVAYLADDSSLDDEDD